MDIDVFEFVKDLNPEIEGILFSVALLCFSVYFIIYKSIKKDDVNKVSAKLIRLMWAAMFGSILAIMASRVYDAATDYDYFDFYISLAFLIIFLITGLCFTLFFNQRPNCASVIR